MEMPLQLSVAIERSNYRPMNLDAAAEADSFLVDLPERAFAFSVRRIHAVVRQAPGCGPAVKRDPDHG